MIAGYLVGDTARLPISSNVADCIVTSPPYNVGMPYEGVNDIRTVSDYSDSTGRWAKEMYRVLKDNRRLWLNVATSVTVDHHERPTGIRANSGRTAAPRLSLLHVWQSSLVDAGFTLIDVVAWCSVRSTLAAWGSFQSPSRPNIRGDWEPVIVACKGDWVRPIPPKFDKWQDDLGNWPELVSTVWTFPPTRRIDHPAPFPDELPRRCIRLSTWPDETVLDPFAGSGTTVRVAAELGRNGVGVELSPIYATRSIERGYQSSFDAGL